MATQRTVSAYQKFITENGSDHSLFFHVGLKKGDLIKAGGPLRLTGGAQYIDKHPGVIYDLSNRVVGTDEALYKFYESTSSITDKLVFYSKEQFVDGADLEYNVVLSTGEKRITLKGGVKAATMERKSKSAERRTSNRGLILTPAQIDRIYNHLHVRKVTVEQFVGGFYLINNAKVENTGDTIKYSGIRKVTGENPPAGSRMIEDSNFYVSYKRPTEGSKRLQEDLRRNEQIHITAGVFIDSWNSSNGTSFVVPPPPGVAVSSRGRATGARAGSGSRRAAPARRSPRRASSTGSAG